MNTKKNDLFNEAEKLWVNHVFFFKKRKFKSLRREEYAAIVLFLVASGIYIERGGILKTKKSRKTTQFTKILLTLMNRE